MGIDQTGAIAVLLLYYPFLHYPGQVFIPHHQSGFTPLPPTVEFLLVHEVCQLRPSYLGEKARSDAGIRLARAYV
jgi:hypothetical protein